MGGIQILVNNVGGMIPGTLDNMGEDVWGTAINLNLMAAVYTTKHAIPHLKKNEHARILNVSGISGTQLLPGSLTTTIPNTALIGFNKLMAADLGASNITVNNICPGMTATDLWVPRAEAMAKIRDMTSDNLRDSISAQTMLGRLAEPREIGDVAAFLVSGPEFLHDWNDRRGLRWDNSSIYSDCGDISDFMSPYHPALNTF